MPWVISWDSKSRQVVKLRSTMTISCWILSLCSVAAKSGVLISLNITEVSPLSLLSCPCALCALKLHWWVHLYQFLRNCLYLYYTSVSLVIFFVLDSGSYSCCSAHDQFVSFLAHISLHCLWEVAPISVPCFRALGLFFPVPLRCSMIWIVIGVLVLIKQPLLPWLGCPILVWAPKSP